MIKKIGFIGTGLMGLPMAKNILKSGYNLKAFNRTQNKAEPLKKFGGEIAETIKDVVKDSDILITMLTDDNAIDEVMGSSDFLNNLSSEEAIEVVIERIEKLGYGKRKTNYRLRDAVFSRQRYWGEPFPIYYKGETAYLICEDKHVELPRVDKYLPTSSGEPPLARSKKEDWNIYKGDRMETNVMPGWAGSSWYFIRYMDPDNTKEFCSREKPNYWNHMGTCTRLNFSGLENILTVAGKCKS